MRHLPKPGDPLVLPNGVVVVDEETREIKRETVQQYQERRTVPHLTRFVSAVSRTEDDLPEKDYKEQAVLTAICGFRLMGLDTLAIAQVFQVTEDYIKELMEKPSAQVTFERMYKGLIHVNADSVQGRIASYADNAVSVVAELMNDKDQRGDVRLKAAQDVLDRSGTGPDHFFGAGEDGTSQDDELKISFMSEDGNGGPSATVEIKRRR